MRILSLEVKGHPSLRDLRLDFCDSSGRPVRTIVLAGENGCGKTSVLELIRELLAESNGNQVQLSARESATIVIELNSTRDLPRAVFPGGDVMVDGRRVFMPGPAFDPVSRLLKVDFNPHKNPVFVAPRWTRQSTKPVSMMRTFSRKTITGEWYSDLDHQSAFPPTEACLYSEANVIFRVPTINTAHAAAADTTRGAPGASGRGDVELGSLIAQLFADLHLADNEELAAWVRNNEGQPPLGIAGRRQRLFASAFSKMFPAKVFLGVERQDREYVPLFRDAGQDIPLSQLSSGEKQIVFRGAMVLSEMRNLVGPIVLIDEPELSLHPRWQQKITSFYEDIVGDGGSNLSQIIVATHSPFIVHGTPLAKHIVLARNQETGKISVDPAPYYPGATSTDIAVSTFDLGDLIQSARGATMALIVEGPTDIEHIKLAWKALRPSVKPPFSIQSGGGAPGIARLLGKEAGTPGPLLEALLTHGFKKVVGLFDFDDAGYGNWEGVIKEKDAEAGDCLDGHCFWRKRRGAPVWACLLPVPPDRASLAGKFIGRRSMLPVELLYSDCYVSEYLSRVDVPGGVAFEVTDNNKRKIIEAASTFPPAAFEGFRPVFDMIDEVLLSKS